MSEEKSNKDIEKNEEEKLPFARAEILRLMKENLSEDKQIRERVKVEMNNFLYSILVDVCRELDKYPGKNENIDALECNQVRLWCIGHGCWKDSQT